MSESRRHVLMIVPFFPPMAGGGVHRPLAFVRYLPKWGWQPTVVAPQPGSFWITDATLLDDVPRDCEVHRTPTFSGQYLLSLLRPGRTGSSAPQVRSSGKFGALRRVASFVLIPDSYIGWWPFAVREGRRLLRARRFDAIYSTSPPETSHLVARALHRSSGLPWVADFRDPWMNMDLLSPPTRLHHWLHGRLERDVCRRASVVVTTTWHQRLLQERYPAANPVTLIANGFDHRKVAQADVRPATSPFRITHAGMLTQQRTAVPFLHALRLVLDRYPEARSNINALFLGPRESRNDEAVREFGLDGVVEFRDTVAHEESLKLQRSSHILLLIKHLDPVYRGMVPGKLYEYIGVERPILALAPEGEAADIVRRLHRGEVAPHDDPGAIADVLQNMYDKYRRGRLDDSYDLEPARQYRREELTSKLAGVLDDVTEGRKA